MLLTNAPRGTKDILPEESAMWQYIEDKIRSLCDRFGYKEIRTPVFEHTELFERGVGDTTDVVQKEMYTFNDKGGRSITLKPEGTAGAARAYLENSVYAGPQPSKLYYITPCFRYEKPQAGRLREFHQFGIEAFGTYLPSIDAEVISMAYLIFKELGIENLKININSIGCPDCRKKYNEALREYFRPHLSELCATCRDRFEKNPLRILDCKSEVCKKIGENAPLLIDHICDDCRDHFEKVKGYLEKMGIEYNIDPMIVRGLDYYTKTVFEFKAVSAGSQGTVCGGGRYDGLVEELGGKPTGGIGFGLGLERLVMTMKENNKEGQFDKTPDIFIGAIGENADVFAQKLVFDLRSEGIKAERDYLERSVKAQMKYADKLGAKYAVVIGDDEIAKGIVNLKNMGNGEQCEVKLSDLATFLKGDK